MLHHEEMHADYYNELIFDPKPWVDGLPDSIAAFFVLPSSSRDDLQRTIRAHAAFKSEYGVNNVPLLTYQRYNMGGPFILRAPT